MAATDISPLFTLYTLSTGRRLFALAQVLKRAESLGMHDLVDHVRAAIEHDKQTHQIDLRWAARGQPSALDVLVQPIDGQVDRCLTALRDAAAAKTAIATAANGLERKVETFLAKVFPLGVKHVTSMVYVDELSAVDQILKQTRGPLAPLAGLVSELGLSEYVERLAELAEEYRAALESQQTMKDLTWGDVRAARAQGHALLLEAVALIIGATRGTSPSAVTARNELLAPILVQNEAVRQYLRSRRRVEDVDPDTGEVDLTAPPSGPSPEVGGNPGAEI